MCACYWTVHCVNILILSSQLSIMYILIGAQTTFCMGGWWRKIHFYEHSNIIYVYYPKKCFFLYK